MARTLGSTLRLGSKRLSEQLGEVEILEAKKITNPNTGEETMRVGIFSRKQKDTYDVRVKELFEPELIKEGEKVDFENVELVVTANARRGFNDGDPTAYMTTTITADRMLASFLKQEKKAS